MKNAGTCMLVFLGGALLGGAAALLFAPKCGADLRSSIKDMIEKEVDAIRCHCEELKEHVH
jgi:gas vesicle protein